MKIANIDRESLHIFWTNWGISLKFSGKMWLMIILKLTKNHGSTVSLEDALSGKPQGGGGAGGGGVKSTLDRPSLIRVNQRKR